MKQLKVGLPDELREQLEAVAAESGKALGEEIRDRLEAGIAGDAETRKLVEAVGSLATLVRLQTGHAWHSHPGANRVMRHALTARLARLKPEGDGIFAPGDLPTARLVAPESDDPEAMGLALEAMDFHTPPMTPDLRRMLDEKLEEAKRELRQRHGQPNKGDKQ
jgi:hypothetical protein